MLTRLVDRIVAAVSPRAGLERMAARASLEAVEGLVGTGAGYDAARLNRLNAFRTTLNENAVDSGTLDRLDGQARDLWRNNPHARKIVRQIQVKTLGKGMRPISQANGPDRRPDFAFRKRALAVWTRWSCQSDSRGRPGRGGQHLADQAKTALGAVVRNGNVLSRLVPLSTEEQARRRLFLPLVLQLIDAGRLDHSVSAHEGREVFRGIELNGDGTVLAYHLLPQHPSDPRGTAAGVGFGAKTKRLPADVVGHAFVSEDIDQVLGVTWFAPALSTIRDTGDYTYTELKAAAMGACVVAGIRGLTGANNALVTGSGITDAAGNPIVRLQPGMILNLGAAGQLEGFNPQRPNTSAVDFVQHLLRTGSTAFPGVKGSTLTGDYRGSSFASERSADNEVWPEIEGVQQWWAFAFQQPVYEAVIVAAVLAGHFDDVVRTEQFFARRDEYLAAEWQGPVQRSINPVDDEKASESALHNGTSSEQIESAKKGRNALELLQDVQEYCDHVDTLDLDDEMKRLLKLRAIGAMPQTGNQPAPQDGAPQDGSAKKPAGDDDEDGDRGFGGLPAHRFPELVGN